MKIQANVKRCKVCQSPKRDQIQQLYLVTYNPRIAGSWLAFVKKSLEIEPEIKLESLKRHFKGGVHRGKTLLPHFAVGISKGDGSNSDIMAQTIENLEEAIAKRGMDIVEGTFKEIQSGVRDIKTSEAINLMGKLQIGMANKRAAIIRMRELSDKNKRFDKALLAGLYGGPIRDAELIENDYTGNDAGDDASRQIDAPSEDNQGAE